ncbi:MAG: hypothetical protein J5856_07585 [Lachnospiraceae bacterium]|nr:hypothetical protein [Lachnospiraceae bacterium]
MKKLNNKTVGIVCMILGAFFFLGGIGYFIVLNFPNTYAKKAEATIVARYEVSSEKDAHTLFEVAYKVGDNMVSSAYSSYEEIPEDQLTIDVYYNIKDPTELVEAGWQFEPIVPAVLGILFIITGLTYLGIISFGFDISEEKTKKGSESDKKYYAAKEKTENALFPIIGLTAVLGFGIFMLVTKKNAWSWVFVGVGGIGILYFLTDLIPSASEMFALKRIRQVKGHSLSVDDDFEKFEKQQKEKESAKNKKASVEKTEDKEKASEIVKDNQKDKKEEIKPEDFEIEETIEIKSLDIKKKKKK